MRMIQGEDFLSLFHLNSMKVKLKEWMEQTEAPTVEEVLQELRRLPEYCKHWTTLQGVLLTAEELLQSGTRQQNLHLLHAMPLALEDGTKTTE